MNRRHVFLLGPIQGLLAILLVNPVHGDFIPITNSSFEEVDSDGLVGAGGFYGFVGSPAGWVSDQNGGGSFTGLFRPDVSSQLAKVPDGIQVGFVEDSPGFPDGGFLLQDLGVTVSPGAHYTLSYFHGDRPIPDGFSHATDYRVELWAGSSSSSVDFSIIDVSPTRPVLGSQSFTSQTISATAADNASGTLYLKFSALDLDNNNNTISQVFFDQITLEVVPAAVPEPASIGLFAIGAICLSFFAWRRRAGCYS